MKVKPFRESNVSFVKQALSLPRNVSIAIRRFRRRGRVGAEAERLDRIRNPQKYLGK